MKTWSKICLWLGVLSLILAVSAWAQPGGMGGRGQRRSMYNPQTVETVRGEVTKVTQSTQKRRGVHLEVKTAKETLMVILGPTSYLEKQNLQLVVGDQVEITGSRVQMRQRTLLFAAELKKGNQVVRLRDEQGLPLWRGQGRRRQ